MSEAKNQRPKNETTPRAKNKAAQDTAVSLPSFSSGGSSSAVPAAASPRMAGSSHVSSAASPRSAPARPSGGSSAAYPKTAAFSVEERLRRAQEEKRASANRMPSGNSTELWDSFMLRLKVWFAKAVSGEKRPKSEVDFPINRSLLGRLKRYGPAKVYRLKGYTTVSRVNRKRQHERIRQHRNRVIFWVAILLVLLVVYVIIDPAPKIHNFMHNIGY